MDGRTGRKKRQRFAKRRLIVSWIIISLVFLSGTTLAILIFTGAVGPGVPYGSDEDFKPHPDSFPTTVSGGQTRRSSVGEITAPVLTTTRKRKISLPASSSRRGSTVTQAYLTADTLAMSTSPETSSSTGAIVFAPSSFSVPTWGSHALSPSTTTAALTSTSTEVPASTSTPTLTRATAGTLTSSSTAVATSTIAGGTTLTSAAATSNVSLKTTTSEPETSTSTAAATTATEATTPVTMNDDVPSTTAELIQTTLVHFRQSNRLYAPIKGGLRPGTHIRVRGTTTRRARSFTIEIQTGEQGNDVSFHFNPRIWDPYGGIVVRNSRLGGYWGSEEQDGPRIPFRRGTPFDLQFQIETNRFRVYVNGQHFIDYDFRVPLIITDMMVVYGDVVIDTIEYFYY